MTPVCSSCKKDKDNLTLQRSVLFPRARIIMCPACIDKGFEPRPLVVLATIHDDSSKAQEFIKRDKYPGDRITASEILH